MFKSTKRLFLAAVLTVVTALGVTADQNRYWPNADYDPSIPTVKSVLGYNSGDKITLHGDMQSYFSALEAAAPNRLKVFEYGTSWEGRKLIYVAISSPENLAKLDTFEEGMQALADPRKTDAAAAKALVADLPASIWLAYSVHGNEISSTDAAMQTAYHLLASRGDKRSAEILSNTIVFINPLQNPDGRDRFITRFRSTMGLEADSDRISAEHNEPWPSGRTNHYLFDLNRDWITLSQPETQGHVAALQKYYPLVFVDVHEMGGDSSYYFAPEAIPFNPHIAQHQRDSLFIFGKNNAKWFDKFGLDYFTRDVFDAFYPGYGASWPSYYGAVSMTYEQASSRGLKYRRMDGTEFDYFSTVRNHFITSMATAESVSQNRETFLSNFYDYQVTAIEEGRKEKGKRSYIFPAKTDTADARKLMGILAAQGVEITRANEGFKACGTNYDAGAFIIDSAQPRKRLLRSVLDPQVDMEDFFLEETERKRRKNISHDIYDVTAWSLTKMFNLDVAMCGNSVAVNGTPVSSDRVDPFTVENTNATVAYLVPWTDGASSRLMAQALRRGLTVKSNDQQFVQNGRTFGRGTLIFDVADNAEDLGQTLAALAKETGAEVLGIDSSWIDSGMDFGSRAVFPVLAPKVAIAWDEPTSQLSAGNTRFVIERQIGYPVTAIRTPMLARADLSRYDVIILPSSWGNYASALGDAKNLSDWVKKGGVLIANGSATRFLTDEKVGLLALKREAQIKEAKDPVKAENGLVPGQAFTSLEDMKKATEPANERPDSVPGVLTHAAIDQDHWITAGVKDTLNVLYAGRDIYAPIELNTGTNAVYFKGADELFSSGYLWDEVKTQLAYKPFTVVQPSGRGFVIAFTSEPTTRAYLDGLKLLYANAIFRGAAHATPTR
ncbi:peptidase M14 [Kordiimonas sediminis]|uniref:Peptidase M14 n=1 Tax=Kordiimonas sediminis TaxID=1735581 RepID=A0A919ATC9_9PROT|nr:M14 family metallopeptidase [Kordiimonas sediminis]GHF23222.1 peptidase M14 [Kordiimonas sediminis]